MKRARIIALGIAFAAAIVAALLAKSLISRPEKQVVTIEKELNTVQVLVAARRIRLGDAIRSGQLRWQSWPLNSVTPDYITQTAMPDAASNLSGSIARSSFLKNEPIKQQKLIKISEGGILAAILAPGMRAISTPIREETAVGGFILPNDHVDVIVTHRVKGRQGQGGYTSETILNNVRVLAIGQDLEQQAGQKIAEGKTAILELTPHMTEILTLAQSLGEISLTLRGLADIKNATNVDPNAFKNDNSRRVKVVKHGVSLQTLGAQ